MISLPHLSETSSKWSCRFEKQELIFSTAVQYMESQLGGGQASCRLS